MPCTACKPFHPCQEHSSCIEADKLRPTACLQCFSLYGKLLRDEAPEERVWWTDRISSMSSLAATSHKANRTGGSCTVWASPTDRLIFGEESDMPATPPFSPPPAYMKRHNILSLIAEMEMQETAHTFNKVFRTIFSTVHSETLSFSLGALSPQGSTHSDSTTYRPDERPHKRPRLALERPSQPSPRAPVTAQTPAASDLPLPSPTGLNRGEAGPSSARSSPSPSLITIDQVDSGEEDEFGPADQDYLPEYEEDLYNYDYFDEEYERFSTAPPSPEAERVTLSPHGPLADENLASVPTDTPGPTEVGTGNPSTEPTHPATGAYLFPEDSLIISKPLSAIFKSFTFTEDDLSFVWAGGHSGLSKPMFRLTPHSNKHPGINDLLTESLRFKPAPRAASKAARFQTTTRLFDESSKVAAILDCRALPDSAELEVNTPAPGILSWLKQPTTPAHPKQPAFEFSGKAGKAKEIFAYLAAPKRPLQPVGDLHMLKGAFRSITPELAALEKTARSKASKAMRLYQTAHLLESAIHTAQSWTDLTPPSETKTFMAQLEKFAQEHTAMLEEGATAAGAAAARASAEIRTHLTKGMKPPVVATILQDSPLIHSDPNVFTDKALREADTKAAEVYMHFSPASFSPATSRPHPPRRGSSSRPGGSLPRYTRGQPSFRKPFLPRGPPPPRTGRTPYSHPERYGPYSGRGQAPTRSYRPTHNSRPQPGAQRREPAYRQNYSRASRPSNPARPSTRGRSAAPRPKPTA